MNGQSIFSFCLAFIDYVCLAINIINNNVIGLIISAIAAVYCTVIGICNLEA